MNPVQTVTIPIASKRTSIQIDDHTPSNKSIGDLIHHAQQVRSRIPSSRNDSQNFSPKKPETEKNYELPNNKSLTKINITTKTNIQNKEELAKTNNINQILNPVLDDRPIEFLNTMDKSDLIDLLVKKTRRIQDLEHSLDEQKRLRLQDASQVEEKAAKIKEWVANKLKELENQNKHLRDQNRKQKQAVETLTSKIASLTPLSSPRKILATRSPIDSTTINNEDDISDHINIIIGQKPANNSDLPAPLGSSSSSANGSGHNMTRNSELQSEPRIEKERIKSIGRSESPIYDSVNLEQVLNKTRTPGQNCNKPPPPPLHRVDDWELQLYNLAEESFSNLLKKSMNDGNSIQSDFDSNSDRDTLGSHKSSGSIKNDLISLVKPHFTTIDGDEVVDENTLNIAINNEDCSIDKITTEKGLTKLEPMSSFMIRRGSNDNSKMPYLQTPLGKLTRCAKYTSSCENIVSKSNQTSTVTNLFDSPLRSRRGPANTILRAHSVRKNPVPEKLHDYISSDLIKRGYLTKPGALKNHQRWFVLKNFYLSSYKSESDETTKVAPNMKLKLDHSCHIFAMNSIGESSYPFKIVYHNKTLQLIAESAKIRDEWVKIMTIAINVSDIHPEAFIKGQSNHEGFVSFTRHGITKRCYGILTKHVIIFLKSLIDPTPLGYVSVRGAKITEITDIYDYEIQQEYRLDISKDDNNSGGSEDCHLAIYPKFSLTPDPTYITLGNQQEVDKWFYHLSIASCVDQSSGTPFERALTKIMLSDSILAKRYQDALASSNVDGLKGCIWKEHPIMMYSDGPISEPLTSLPNETLRVEAIELFKSILLFIQVPIEPVAIDYHVSLLQNCLARFIKFPELRNEFYAQLIKQSTYVLHRCSRSSGSTSTGSSSGCSPTNERSSSDSMTHSSSECQFITDTYMLQSMNEVYSTESCDPSSPHSTDTNKIDSLVNGPTTCRVTGPPSSSELLQVMQILSISVSLNLPRGRIRWWLSSFLSRFADTNKNIGKYALYTLKAMERTLANGSRENIPSRTEIISILLRNPYDHSHPHSLPVTFPDGSYLVVGADGSTTVEEFMTTMGRQINIRNSSLSDFYLFADDPADSKEVHILEPQRKIFDIVGWWEQSLRRHNSGRYQSTRVIKLLCKKRLILKAEIGETAQERLMIVHQANQEIVGMKVPICESLNFELAAIMSQLSFGNYDDTIDKKLFKSCADKIWTTYLRQTNYGEELESYRDSATEQVLRRWQSITGRSVQECVRVYLNCIRRLKIN